MPAQSGRRAIQAVMAPPSQATTWRDNVHHSPLKNSAKATVLRTYQRWTSGPNSDVSINVMR